MGLILNIIFFIFIKSIVLRYVMLQISSPSSFNVNLEKSMF